MKNRVFASVLALIIICTSAFAATAAQIPLDSPLYQQMDTLYRLTGRPLPSSSRPWNTYEAIALLEAIAKDGPYESLRVSIARQLGADSLHRVDETFGWRITPTISMEGYLHTNPTDFTTYSDWIYSYDQRRPMLDLDIAMQYGSTLYFATSLQAGVGAFSEDLDGPNNPKFGEPVGALYPKDTIILPTTVHQYRAVISSNLYTSGLNFEADFPRRSQLTVAGPWWAVSLGRGPRLWGHGITGNLIIGDHISNHTSLSASFFNPVSKIQLLYLLFTNSKISGMNRIFLGHRFEFQPLPWARFSISENIMVLINRLSPQFFDPTYMYHNVYDEKSANAIAALEMEFAITNGLSLHLQGGLDQFQLPTETAPTANAMAWLANLSYSWQHARGYWTAQSEFVMIDPSFYRRQDVDFLVARDLIKNQGSGVVIVDYLGHRWGSDSMVYTAQIGYFVPDLLELSGAISIHRQGEMVYTKAHDGADNSSDPIVNGPPPSPGKITDRLMISFGGKWLTSIKGLAVYGQIDWIGRRELSPSTKSTLSEEHDIQLIVGISMSF